MDVDLSLSHIGTDFRYVCLIVGVQIKHCDDTDEFEIHKDIVCHISYF